MLSILLNLCPGGILLMEGLNNIPPGHKLNEGILSIYHISKISLQLLLDRNFFPDISSTFLGQRHFFMKYLLNFNQCVKYIFLFYSFLFQAITDYKMIKDGDHVLLCLSGGKDSLSMLHIIHQYQFYARSKVKITFNL